MKKVLLTSLALLAIATISIVGFGCSTTSNTNTTALEQFAITSGTAVGVSELLSQSGGAQYRPDFVIAEVVLTDISTGTNTLTTAEVNSLLSSAGVTNSVIAPIIVNGFTLADSYAASGTNATVQQVAGWIDLGIAEGLGSTFHKK